MKKALWVIITVTAVLCSCRDSRTAADQRQGDTLRLKYAEKLTIVRHEGFTEVLLADPWNTGKTLHRYILVNDDVNDNDDDNENDDVNVNLNQYPNSSVIRVPLKRSVIATSVQCGLIEHLGKREAIAGVCDLQYINLPWVQEECRKGRIADCGSGLQPTIEKIIDLRPDALFLSPFQNSGGYGKLETLQVPIIEMADYMESSALGRAEWMKFYGMLFGREKEADSLFAAVEKNYMSLRDKVSSFKSQVAGKHRPSPKILMDKQTGSVWYVPGGRSTIGRLIGDAGADYPWQGDDHSGSLPLSFESVLEKGGPCDIWLFRYNSPHAITAKELLSEKPAYNQFKAFQKGEIYGCNTATSTFYEDTPFRPDLLLRDFITICYPELGLGEPVYFVKVKNQR